MEKIEKPYNRKFKYKKFIARIKRSIVLERLEAAHQPNLAGINK